MLKTTLSATILSKTPLSMISRFLCLLVLVFGQSLAAAPVAIPENLIVIGFNGKSWNVYQSEKGVLKALKEIHDPRSFSLNPVNGAVAFVGSDSHLYLYQSDSGKKIRLSDTENNLRYAQPYFTESGDELYIVQLPEGKSRRTEIVSISMKDNLTRYKVRKRTAQFEPYTRDGNHLYYSTAICVDDCEGMIWELWRRDNTTAKQVQLTLLNHVSNQPHLSLDNWLYFSSNASGDYFHIWRMMPEVGAKPEQLTFGKTRDSEPFTDKNNNLYFIRKTPGGTKLMSLIKGELVPLATPELITDFRNLEVR